jgi:hypothetical protein
MNNLETSVAFELTLLYFMDSISKDEYDSIYKMLMSDDSENHTIAVLAIETFKKRKRENQIANQKEAG